MKKISPRDRYYRNKYGITLSQYNKKHRQQKGLCAICGAAEKIKDGKVFRLHVDHNHKTGIVRGLICFKCNKLLIGQLERMYKNPFIVVKGLTKYIKKYQFLIRAKKVLRSR